MYGKERALMKIWASKSLWTSWFWMQPLNTSEGISPLLHKRSSVTELGEMKFSPGLTTLALIVSRVQVRFQPKSEKYKAH